MPYSDHWDYVFFKSSQIGGKIWLENYLRMQRSSVSV